MTIWTADVLQSNFRPYAQTVWRVVEAQHIASTMKLVDTLSEQKILEDELEAVKPQIPPHAESLHYLLARPFAFQDYPRASRFRPSGISEGVYYAAEHVETAIAEMSFSRLLFFTESPACSWPTQPGDYTAFSVPIATQNAIQVSDLQDGHKALHPHDYSKSQELALKIRQASGDTIIYRSARDPKHRNNVALLTSDPFQSKTPKQPTQTWIMHIQRGRVRARRDFPSLDLEFLISDFDDPRLNGV